MSAHAAAKATISDGREVTDKFPSRVLFDFFREARVRLERAHHRNDCLKVEKDRIPVPPSLDSQRQSLINLQLDALRWAIDSYNQSSSGNEKSLISLEDAQHVIRQIGARDYSQIATADEEDMINAAAAMNNAARHAFSRSVLISEIEWEGMRENDKSKSSHLSNRSLVDSSNGTAMEPSVIVEFCGLCNTAVCLPEVQHHLWHGCDLRMSLTSVKDISQFECAETREGPDGSRTQSPQELLGLLQRRIFRAVGYDPDFGDSELRRIFFSNRTGEGGDSVSVDPDLADTFARFLSNMSIAVTNAGMKNNNVTSPSGKMLSDIGEGGVTRVVSVEYSEKFLGEGEMPIGPSAPVLSTMEEHSEAEKMRQLAMAQQAAALQRSILGELLSMEKDKRNATLEKARESHEAFLRKALSLPSGPDRMDFLQNVDAEQQKLLLMHKLWESMLADNDGKEPENIQ